MRVIILTQYFPPETGAPQNRLSSLAQRLATHDDVQVQVLTAMPNYPLMRVHEAYRGKFMVKEIFAGIEVLRSWIFVSRKRTVFHRLMNYFSFAFTSLLVGIFYLRKADVFFCESPPLFLGPTAVILSRLKGAKLVFNVSDLWPESAERLGIIKNSFLLSASYRLERWLYRASELVTCQTQGIEKSIQSRFPDVQTYWLPNGAEIGEFKIGAYGNTWRTGQGISPATFIVLYAGIIGHAQGLELLIRAADITREDADIKYVLLGDGPEKQGLMVMARDKNLKNILFLNSVSSAAIPSILDSVDAVVVPLKRLDIFKGAIPSKIFEAMAMGKPVLLGVEGEAYELFITRSKVAMAFEPENADDLVRQISLLRSDAGFAEALGAKAREYVELNFNRETISEQFLKQLKELCS